MSIPPFPPRELAKLVLGYLSEEQLMTAYDEFLQASPYLDAYLNEYDRLFMTSLSDMINELWMVKIHVENCHPLPLRRRLRKCANLLEAFKFLISIADISKLEHLESCEKQSKTRRTSPYNKSPKEGMGMSSTSTIGSVQGFLSRLKVKSHEKPVLESSLETTAAETLPGNVVRKEDEKRKEADTPLLHTAHTTASDLADTQSVVPTTDINRNQNHEASKVTQTSSLVTHSSDAPDCMEKIEEFNNIFNKVCENKSTVKSRQSDVSDNSNKHVSTSANLHELPTAEAHTNNTKQTVSRPNTTPSTIVKDKSTSHIENVYATSPIPIAPMTGNAVNTSKQKWFTITPEPRQKDSKIKIISDIKVDNHVATAQPMMQTIRINGTPIYRHQPPKSNYTSDEIMAMPTLILVPATGQPSTVCQSEPKSTMAKDEVTTKTVAAEPVLGPLVIDVSSNSIPNQSMPGIQPGVEPALVKTVDIKNASVPKDNTIASAIETSTPHVLPPTRKSSSTPRRNSHIRVLDFTAPRRILQETIPENVPCTATLSVEDTTEDKNQPVATAQNPENIVDMSAITVHKIECPSNFKLKPVKEFDKKKNWDADLRALLAADEPRKVVEKKPVKTKISKKKPIVDKAQTKKETETNAKKVKTNKSPKKKDKRKQKPKEDNEDEPNAVKDGTKLPVKPTIKVIPGDILPASQEVVSKNNSHSTNDSKNNSDCNASKEKNNVDDATASTDNKKANNSDEVHETPEAERISLQNVIGVKLNISELLETPYKQALYDIQMETPKFLGPDLPGEPISDIKIMSIPTPRFFDTPKPAQTTPSSYSSRPTDYSSGGSYYKPDDQDYIPIPEIDCPMVSIPDSVIESPNDIENKENKKTRPVRKCAKNVSYSLNQNTSNKAKSNEKNEGISVSNNLQSSNKADESKIKTKAPQSNESKYKTKTPQSKPKAKSDTIKKSSKTIAKSSLKYKSPIKKSSSFIKIKPRQPTPVKLPRKSNKKLDRSQIGSSKKAPCRISGKDQIGKNSPVRTCLPTKSRRKSSTPRKLHCSKSFHSESSGQDSPEVNRMISEKEPVIENKVSISHDSDTEQLALRWSDDGSQDSKVKKTPNSNESEDILKIQEYIKTTTVVHTTSEYEPKGSFHKDLIIRGFDAETAKIIERDLLDTPPHSEQCQVRVEIIQSNKVESVLDKSIETSSSCTTNLQIDQEEETEDEIELSVYECDEDCSNFIVTSYDYTKEPFQGLPVKLKDKFTVEVCIDDGNPIRMRATDFTVLLEQEPQYEGEIDYRETEQAVQSICNIDKLYTPLKDLTKVRCYEIFDSTLTSLDTPLKAASPKPREDDVTEIEIIVDEDCNNRTEIRKRKRVSSNSPEHESAVESKKNKSEAQLLLKSADIQNIDIETVLTKLHGP